MENNKASMISDSRKTELSLQEIQKGSLEILRIVAKICDKQGLIYYLAYGTLIGAIRHKGFIPWDDDIDIWMPRNDYKKFIEYFIKHKDELKPYELFSVYNNVDYPYEISRISDNRYVLDVDNEAPYGIGLFIDIYPLDGVGNSETEYTRLKNKASRYSSLCFLSTRLRFEKGTTKSKLKMAIKFPAFFFSKILGKKFWINQLEKMGNTSDYTGSKYIGALVWGHDGVRAIFPKEWFSKTCSVDFEGEKYTAPVEYDKVLTRLYGDYMKLPSEKKRIPHHNYKAFRKEEV